MEWDLNIPEEYHGKWVAYRFIDKKVVASGDTPIEARKAAEELGCNARLIVLDNETKEILYNDLGVLENGESFTSNKNTRKIYPITGFKKYCLESKEDTC